MKKLFLALLLSLLLLAAACAAPEQAPEPGPAPESPSSVSASASSEPPPVPASPGQKPEPVQPEEQQQLFERANKLYEELKPVLGGARESVGYFYVSTNVSTKKVELVVGAVDEAAVDSLLASWTGEPWDVLKKEACSCSLAQQEAFAEAARKLELAPGVRVSAVTAEMEAFDLRGVQISVQLDDLWAPREEVERWAEMPREIRALAEEMGVPEGMISYTAPQYAPPESNPCPNVPQENPSTFTGEKEEADFTAQMERVIAIEKALPPVMETVEDSYESYCVDVDEDWHTMKVYLKIWVTDEEKVDQALATYQGEPWDAVIKEKGRCSVTQMKALVAELKKIEVEPGVYMDAYLSAPPYYASGAIYAWVDGQSELGQRVKDLAREMGIPEEMLCFPPGEWLTAGGTITNPDT